MIFNAQPYYNEPGHEYYTDTTQVEMYNRAVEVNTAHYAMFEWLAHRLAVSNQPAASTSHSSRSTTDGSNAHTTGESSKPVALITSTPNPPSIASSTASAVQSFAAMLHPGNWNTLPDLLHFEPTTHPDQHTTEFEQNIPVTTTNPSDQPTQFTFPFPEFGLPLALSETHAAQRHKSHTKQPPHGKADDGIWGEVIRKHCELHAKSVLATVRKWKDQSYGGKTYEKMAKAVAQLEDILDKHGFHD